MDSTDDTGTNPTTDRPRFRPHDWINTNTLQPCYGIQAAVGKRGWMNVSHGSRPMLFATAAERDAAIIALDEEANFNVR